MDMRKLLFLFSLLFAVTSTVKAENTCMRSDSLMQEKALCDDSITRPDTVIKKKSLFTRFLDYFNDANKNKKRKKFDFSVIGGPHYSTDTELGIGLVAAGLYQTCPTDTLLPPSNVSLYGDFSTVGFYLLGIRGTNIFPQDKYRLTYTLYFFSFPSYTWGMGYEMGNNNDNKSKLKRWQSKIKTAFLFRLADNFYFGPSVAFDYVSARSVEREELLEGQDKTVWNIGGGFSLMYDSRDVLTNPHKGVFLNVSQTFRPKFIGNEYAFSTTELQTCAYTRPWKGAILAFDLESTLNFGNPSWAMMAKLGGSNSMRGYYEGRYRDKHKIETQVELRQHVWKRNGIVLWVGAGTVFKKFSALTFDKVLPNYGLGYRWEFKKNVNVRLDYGFGKSGQSGFLFNINEAF